MAPGRGAGLVMRGTSKRRREQGIVGASRPAPAGLPSPASNMVALLARAGMGRGQRGVPGVSDLLDVAPDIDADGRGRRMRQCRTRGQGGME